MSRKRRKCVNQKTDKRVYGPCLVPCFNLGGKLEAHEYFILDYMCFSRKVGLLDFTRSTTIGASLMDCLTIFGK